LAELSFNAVMILREAEVMRYKTLKTGFWSGILEVKEDEGKA